MCADVDFPISVRTHYSAAPNVLMETLKHWLEKKDATHLIHPLGFWVVLLKRSDAEEWRFHFWPTGERKTEGMPATIHTHDRLLESRVILGRIRSTLYREADSGQAMRPIYEVAYGGDRFVQGTANVLRNTGQLTTVIPIAEQALKVGDRYRVGAQTYHQVVVESSVAAATVVRVHSRVVGVPKILGLPGFPDRITFQRTSGSSGELLRLLP